MALTDGIHLQHDTVIQCFLAQITCEAWGANLSPWLRDKDRNCFLSGFCCVMAESVPFVAKADEKHVPQQATVSHSKSLCKVLHFVFDSWGAWFSFCAFKNSIECSLFCQPLRSRAQRCCRSHAVHVEVSQRVARKGEPISVGSVFCVRHRFNEG